MTHFVLDDDFDDPEDEDSEDSESNEEDGDEDDEDDDDDEEEIETWQVAPRPDALTSSLRLTSSHQTA
jgi:hypothetical protein